MANSVDTDQTAPIGAVCSGSTLFASIINSSVMLGNYLQQSTSADDIFRCIFFYALYGLNSAHFHAREPLVLEKRQSSRGGHSRRVKKCAPCCEKGK